MGALQQLAQDGAVVVFQLCVGDHSSGKEQDAAIGVFLHGEHLPGMTGKYDSAAVVGLDDCHGVTISHIPTVGNVVARPDAQPRWLRCGV
mgnify:FL=1